MRLIERNSRLVKQYFTFHWNIENLSVDDLVEGADCPIKSPSFKCGGAHLHLEMSRVPGEIQLRVVQSASDDSSWCTYYDIELLLEEILSGPPGTSSTPMKFCDIAHSFPTKLFKNFVVKKGMTVRFFSCTATLEHHTNAQSETETTGNEKTNPVKQEDPPLSKSLENVSEDSRSSGVTSQVVHGQDKDLKQGFVTLSKNMENMLENSPLSDVTLKVGEDTFQAHKNVLACRSKVFAAMFASGMKEGLENEVNLVDMKSATAKEMLQYIYAGKIQELSMDRALDLYVAADRYDLQELKGWCKEFILKHISADDVCKVAVLADLHTDEKLAEAAKRVFKEQSKLILGMKGWRDFAKKNPDVYADLVESTF